MKILGWKSYEKVISGEANWLARLLVSGSILIGEPRCWNVRVSAACALTLFVVGNPNRYIAEQYIGEPGSWIMQVSASCRGLVCIKPDHATSKMIYSK